MPGLDLTPVPASGRSGRTALEDVDTTVAETVEEAFAYCSANADRLQTPAFPTKEDAEGWLHEARSYAYHRPAGRVVVNGNPSRAPVLTADGKDTGRKDKVLHVIRFRVEPFVAPAETPANGAAGTE